MNMGCAKKTVDKPKKHEDKQKEKNKETEEAESKKDRTEKKAVTKRSTTKSHSTEAPKRGTTSTSTRSGEESALDARLAAAELMRDIEKRGKAPQQLHDGEGDGGKSDGEDKAYNCWAALSGKAHWTSEKAEWCCKNKELGCGMANMLQAKFEQAPPRAWGPLKDWQLAAFLALTATLVLAGTWLGLRRPLRRRRTQGMEIPFHDEFVTHPAQARTPRVWQLLLEEQ